MNQAKLELKPPPTPEERLQEERQRNARLWLQSIDPDLTPEQRLEINDQIDDALVLFAAIGYHVAYVRLQADCANYNRETGRHDDYEKRLQWIREDADQSLQCFHDMLKLIYEKEGSGGPAGDQLGPELKKAARILLQVAQEATASTGREIDLFTLRLNEQRHLPQEDQPPQENSEDD